jgi:branched-chain amino acid transport system ATP-binding protein
MANIKLHVNHISLSFGGIKALHDIDFKVYEGEILAVIGPNGAGKTSLINSINGFYQPQQVSEYRAVHEHDRAR